MVVQLIRSGTPLDDPAGRPNTGARAQLINRAADMDDSRGSFHRTPATVANPNAEGAEHPVLAGVQRALEVRNNLRALSSSGSYDQPIQHDDRSRRFAHLSLVDLARESLRAMGVPNVEMMAPETICRRALTTRRSLGAGTSDFPTILENVANQRLQMAYAGNARRFSPLVVETTTGDFKQLSRPQMGEGPSLEVVPEHGVYSMTAVGEKGEKYAVQKHGRILSFSWESMLNDDLSAFDRHFRQFGANAGRAESSVFWNLISSNVVMGDGNALFSAAHSNDITSSTALNVAGLSAARALLAKQTGLDGQYIDLEPAWLIVDPDAETAAQQYTAQITPDQGGNVNPFSRTFRGTIAEPRLPATHWFVAASTDQTEIGEICRLRGMENGPMIETETGFESDCLRMKCRHVFGAAMLEWVGIVRVAH